VAEFRISEFRIQNWQVRGGDLIQNAKLKMQNGRFADGGLIQNSRKRYAVLHFVSNQSSELTCSRLVGRLCNLLELNGNLGGQRKTQHSKLNTKAKRSPNSPFKNSPFTIQIGRFADGWEVVGTD